MFNLLKKKNEKVVNEVFGEITYYPSRYGSGKWVSERKLPLTLWNRQYELEIYIRAADKNSDLMIQEKAYVNLKENIDEKQKEIEKILKDHIEVNYVGLELSKSEPSELYIGSNGECVIADFVPEEYYLEEMSDDDPGIAVWVFPELRVDGNDDYVFMR